MQHKLFSSDFPLLILSVLAAGSNEPEICSRLKVECKIIYEIKVYLENISPAERERESRQIVSYCHVYSLSRGERRERQT